MIVGLGFAARVGKDSTAEILVHEHGFKRLAFADRLKEVALSTNPIVNGTHHLKHVVDEVGWEGTKSLFPESRVFLQRLGVACRELVADDVWVRPVIDAIYGDDNFQFEGEQDWVITDVRFKNECVALRDLAWPLPLGRTVHLVNVTRPGYGTGDSHVSETELRGFNWDYELKNDGTLDDLGFRVERMLDAFRTPTP